MEKIRRGKDSRINRLNAKYYEDPIGNACKNYGEIKELWEVVEDNQKDISYSFEIVAHNVDYAIVNFKMERIFIPNNEKQFIDGIFIIAINEKGLCTYFKQWRFTKTQKITD